MKKAQDFASGIWEFIKALWQHILKPNALIIGSIALYWVIAFTAKEIGYALSSATEIVDRVRDAQVFAEWAIFVGMIPMLAMVIHQQSKRALISFLKEQHKFPSDVNFDEKDGKLIAFVNIERDKSFFAVTCGEYTMRGWKLDQEVIGLAKVKVKPMLPAEEPKQEWKSREERQRDDNRQRDDRQRDDRQPHKGNGNPNGQGQGKPKHWENRDKQPTTE